MRSGVGWKLAAAKIGKGTGASSPTSVKRSLCALAIAALSLAVFACSASSALAAAPEEPVTESATAVLGTTATLHGVLYPHSTPEAGATYEFLYKATGSPSKAECESASASRAPASPEAVSEEAQQVSQAVSGLAENTEYVVCLATTNAEATPLRTVGEPVAFTTHAAPPVISGEPAKNVTETTATVEAKVNPEGLETYVYVEYGTELDTAPVLVGASVTEETVSFSLNNLRPGTTYPYHVVAFNSQGLVAGAEGLSFKTLETPVPPPPHGESPWWHLTAGARPTYLKPGTGTAVDEVQEIVATPGEFGGGKGILLSISIDKQEIGKFGTGVFVELFGQPPATPENIQKALEEKAYGSGGVIVKEVSPPAGSPEGTLALQITDVNPSQFFTPVVPLEATQAIGGGETETKIVTKSSFTGPQIIATVANLGDAPTHSCSKVAPGTGKYTRFECEKEAVPANTGEYEKTPVDVTVKLPAGVTVVGDEGCSLGMEPNTLICSDEGAVVPYGQLEIRIDVEVHANAKLGKEEEVEVAVTGGGAPATSIRRPMTVSNEATPFGLETFELTNVNEGGAPDTQAASHPFQTTFTTNLNTSFGGFGSTGKEEALPAALAKDLYFRLPPGLIGNPAPFAQCTLAQFFHKPHPTCASGTIMGVAMITFDEPGVLGIDKVAVPVFNLEPQTGEPARFGFLVTSLNPVFIDSAVRSGEDYGIMGKVQNITQTAALISSEVTFWGVPGAPQHDSDRCIGETEGCQEHLGTRNPPPFFELPASCTGPQEVSVEGDSWTDPTPPAAFPTLATKELPALGGCNRLPFRPSISVKADGEAASSASGLTVDVHIPQEESLNPEGLGEADPRDITVALPPGVAVNPSGGNGLDACSEGLVGYQGKRELKSQPGTETLIFSPYLPESIAAIAAGDNEPLLPGVNFCANASKIGTVTIKLPVLPKGQDVTGAVYLADQNANPFGSLIALYVVAEDPTSGILVKVAGEVQLCKSVGEPGRNEKGEPVPGITCQALGQLITTFENSPQAPFEDAEFHFFGGERAPMATPSRCGTYTTSAVLAQWSAEPGEAPHTATSNFNITSGPNGSPCPGASLPFSPSLTGGATNVNAGAFSPFTLTMSRKDGEQNMQSVEAHLPPGLSGVLSNVELCPEPQANEGKCPGNSQIGESTVSVGVGGDPFSVSGGKFYVTGPYNGTGGCTVGEAGCAPFGITFEVPAKAGPFDLERNSANPGGEDACDCVIVRGKIEVNPLTAAITITSNPPGTPDSIPTSIEGIPLEIQHINAITTRGDFQFNPTNCNKMEVTGTIHSSEGGTDTIGVPFQVANCKNLNFTPKFAVSTNAHTSKADGASLTTTVTEPPGSLGTQTNLAKVKVELPKQLPSRLTTLQKACIAKQFETNPADCPPESKIGYAVVHTPLVPVPLEGPAIFVSHGGEAFPSLTMVLQGYGITIDLVGSTFIKSGVTSTTFKTVPDQPFSSFQLTLPTGKYSALTALGNVCQESLKMPTEFVAQNGMEIHQTTPISVVGCKKLTRSQKLKAALAVCRKKDHDKAKRKTCERAARKSYGPAHKTKRKSAKKK